MDILWNYTLSNTIAYNQLTLLCYYNIAGLQDYCNLKKTFTFI